MGVHGVVLGASGYSAAELLRLLVAHPVFEVVALGAGTAAGEPLERVQPHLLDADLPPVMGVDEALERDAEVVFSCLPAEAATDPETDAVVVDLSDAHRAADGWIYGLTEYCRSSLPARRVANPGCYPTAVLLALLPFAETGVLSGPVIVDAMSGYSGAGRSLDHDKLFAAAHGDMTAYGTTEHRHVPEMERQVAAFTGMEISVSFTPHLVPTARGLVATMRAPLSRHLSNADALSILRDAYADERFVKVSSGWPRAKATVGSNSAIVSARVDARNDLLVMSAAIDNLGKGAAGQAIQNANVVFGLDEALGLQDVGMWP